MANNKDENKNKDVPQLTPEETQEILEENRRLREKQAKAEEENNKRFEDLQRQVSEGLQAAKDIASGEKTAQDFEEEAKQKTYIQIRMYKNTPVVEFENVGHLKLPKYVYQERDKFNVAIDYLNIKVFGGKEFVKVNYEDFVLRETTVEKFEVKEVKEIPFIENKESAELVERVSYSETTNKMSRTGDFVKTYARGVERVYTFEFEGKDVVINSKFLA